MPFTHGEVINNSKIFLPQIYIIIQQHSTRSTVILSMGLKCSLTHYRVVTWSQCTFSAWLLDCDTDFVGKVPELCGKSVSSPAAITQGLRMQSVQATKFYFFHDLEDEEPEVKMLVAWVSGRTKSVFPGENLVCETAVGDEYCIIIWLKAEGPKGPGQVFLFLVRAFIPVRKFLPSWLNYHFILSDWDLRFTMNFGEDLNIWAAYLRPCKCVLTQSRLTDSQHVGKDFSTIIIVNISALNSSGKSQQVARWKIM